MNPWQLLGIARDADTQAIKRAYAVKIKQHRPDVDPEMFQKVHQAYKNALAGVRVRQLQQADRESSAQGYAATQAVGIVQSTSNSPQPHPLNNEATLDAYQPTVVLNNAVIEQLVVVDASAVECAEPFEVAPDPVEMVADSGHTAEPDPQVDNELQLQQAAALKARFAMEEEQERQAQAAKQAEQARQERLAKLAEQSQQEQLALQAEQAQRALQEEQLRQETFATLLKQVDELLTNIDGLVVVNKWHFLAKTTLLLDSEFNHTLSVQIYRRIVNYGKKPLSRRLGSRRRRVRKIAQYVPYEVLSFLDQLFNWQGQRAYLQGHVDSAGELYIFNKLDGDDAIDPVEGLRGHATVVRKQLPPKSNPTKFSDSFDLQQIIMFLVSLSFIGQLLRALLE